MDSKINQLWLLKSSQINEVETNDVYFTFINLLRFYFDPQFFLLDSTPTIPSPHLKYLGIIIDNKLSFFPYIKYINEKAKALYNVMKQVSGIYLATASEYAG